MLERSRPPFLKRSRGRNRELLRGRARPCGRIRDRLGSCHLHCRILSVSGRRGKSPPLSQNRATPQWRGKLLQWREGLGLSVRSWALVERNARLDPTKSVELTRSSHGFHNIRRQRQ